jgi:hypothetical protein
MKTMLFGAEFDVRFYREHVVLNRSRLGSLFFRKLSPPEKRGMEKGHHPKGHSIRTHCVISQINSKKKGREKYERLVDAHVTCHSKDKQDKIVGFKMALANATLELSRLIMMTFCRGFAKDFGEPETMPISEAYKQEIGESFAKVLTVDIKCK